MAEDSLHPGPRAAVQQLPAESGCMKKSTTFFTPQRDRECHVEVM